MQLALYKGTRPGLAGVFNRAVRWWTNGPYSHCEIVLQALEGGMVLCASASNTDGGVRIKAIALDPDRWDLIDMPSADHFAVRKWFAQHDGQGYDFLGLAGFVLRRADGSKRRWYCSEACAAALDIPDPWRYCPNTLAAVVQRMNRK